MRTPNQTGRSCHEGYTGSQLHLVRPKAGTVTDTASTKGGSCATRCHDTPTYERT